MITRRFVVSFFVVFLLLTLGFYCTLKPVYASPQGSPLFNLRNQPAGSPEDTVPQELEEKVSSVSSVSDTSVTGETLPADTAFPSDTSTIPAISDTEAKGDTASVPGVEKADTPVGHQKQPSSQATGDTPVTGSEKKSPGEIAAETIKPDSPAKLEKTDQKKEISPVQAVDESTHPVKETAPSTTLSSPGKSDKTTADKPVQKEEPAPPPVREITGGETSITAPPLPGPLWADLGDTVGQLVTTPETFSWPKAGAAETLPPAPAASLDQPTRTSNLGTWGWGVGSAFGIGIFLFGIYLWLRLSRPRVFDSSFGKSSSSSTTTVSSRTSVPPSAPRKKKTKPVQSSASQESETKETGPRVPIWRYPDEKLEELGIDPKYREVFKLYYGRDKSIEEIAGETDFGAGEVGLVLNLSDLISKT